jgi:glutamate racemase
MKVGVFDSGFGGLSILRSVVKVLPQYDYIYLGDNARVPYGNRSPEVIYQFTCEAVDYLFKEGCLLVLLACNTATSNALRRLQTEYLPQKYPDKKVLGVVRPTVEAISSLGAKRIGVIGTRATVNSGSFSREINKEKKKTKVFEKACPLLVPIIEEDVKNMPLLKLVLKDCLMPLQAKKIDTLVLGCTHYELVEKEVAAFMGKNIKVVSEGKIVAEKLKEYLQNHPEIEKKLRKRGWRQYFFTDLNSRYRNLARFFMKQKNIPDDYFRLVHFT